MIDTKPKIFVLALMIITLIYLVINRYTMNTLNPSCPQMQYNEHFTDSKTIEQNSLDYIKKSKVIKLINYYNEGELPENTNQYDIDGFELTKTIRENNKDLTKITIPSIFDNYGNKCLKWSLNSDDTNDETNFAKIIDKEKEKCITSTSGKVSRANDLIINDVINMDTDYIMQKYTDYRLMLYKVENTYKRYYDYLRDEIKKLTTLQKEQDAIIKADNTATANEYLAAKQEELTKRENEINIAINTIQGNATNTDEKKESNENLKYYSRIILCLFAVLLLITFLRMESPVIERMTISN